MKISTALFLLLYCIYVWCMLSVAASKCSDDDATVALKALSVCLSDGCQASPPQDPIMCLHIAIRKMEKECDVSESDNESVKSAFDIALETLDECKWKSETQNEAKDNPRADDGDEEDFSKHEGHGKDQQRGDFDFDRPSATHESQSLSHKHRAEPTSSTQHQPVASGFPTSKIAAQVVPSASLSSAAAAPSQTPADVVAARSSLTGAAASSMPHAASQWQTPALEPIPTAGKVVPPGPSPQASSTPAQPWGAAQTPKVNQPPSPRPTPSAPTGVRTNHSLTKPVVPAARALPPTPVAAVDPWTNFPKKTAIESKSSRSQAEHKEEKKKAMSVFIIVFFIVMSIIIVAAAALLFRQSRDARF